MCKDSLEKLLSPGKIFFLYLAAKVVNNFNQKRDENGLTYDRRELIDDELDGLEREQSVEERVTDSRASENFPETHQDVFECCENNSEGVHAVEGAMFYVPYNGNHIFSF